MTNDESDGSRAAPINHFSIPDLNLRDSFIGNLWHPSGVHNIFW